MGIKQTEDFLYPDNLDSYHKGILEKGKRSKGNEFFHGS